MIDLSPLLLAGLCFAAAFGFVGLCARLKGGGAS